MVGCGAAQARRQGGIVDRKRLRGPALAGAAVLALGAGATVAMGYGHVGGGASQGNGPPERPVTAGGPPERPVTPSVGPGSQGNGPQPRGRGRQVIGAWLDAEQLTSTPTGDLAEAHGKFEAKLNRRGRMRMWVGNATLHYEGVSGSASAALYMGAFGTAGEMQLSICGTSDTPDCSNGLRMRMSLTNLQLNAIKRGDYYVKVNTGPNPAGELRGQLGAVYRVRANLTAGQVRPRPRRPRSGATGRLRGYLVKYGHQGHLDTTLTYRRLSGSATAAHIHRGVRRRAGGDPIVNLCGESGTPGCLSGLVGMHEVQGDVLRALLHRRAYVNVHTGRNPAGEIRGQIRTPRAR